MNKNIKKQVFKIPVYFIIFCIVLPLSASFSAEKKLTVIASTTQIADFSRNIAGDLWDVKCILAPGADPHTYMPAPEDARAVMAADLALQNGLNLEGKNWMANLVKDSGKKLVTCTDGIKLVLISESGAEVRDPHAWFSTGNASVYVTNIMNAFIEMDKRNEGVYRANASLYIRQLRVLDSWIKERFSLISVEKRILVTSHDAFNYFCREYGFNHSNGYLSLAPVGWSTGSEVGAGMTPQRRKDVVYSIKNSGAAAVFFETSVNPKVMGEIARESGVRIGGSLYSDSMGNPGTGGESYIGMMRENANTIFEALRPR